MKKLLIVFAMLLFVGCFSKEEAKDFWDVTEDSKAFKAEYEKDNNEVYSNGMEYIVLDIPEANPFVYVDYDETIELIENGTGILFLSRPGCPFCRSTMDATIEFAEKNKIEKIFYYNPEEIRTANNDDYRYLMSLLDEYLPIDKVTQHEEDPHFDENLKRIVVPHLFFIYEGEVVYQYQEGRSEFMTELSKEQIDEIISTYETGYLKLKNADPICSDSKPEEC